MSSVGRIFTVLNLLLAGFFFYFSGVYLQKATDWKGKYDAEAKAHAADTAQATERERVLSDRLNDADRKLNVANSNVESLNTQLKAASEKNDANEKRIAGLQGDLATLTANSSTISGSVERATAQAEASFKLATESSQSKDEAIRKMEVALGDLRDATDKIAALEASVSDREGQIAALEATIREQGVKLEYVAERFPGALAFAQPKLSGSIQHVGGDGKLVTILVTDDPAEAGVKAGYTFAVYNNGEYKGEAQVTDVDGKFAFCRMTRTNGKAIAVGDAATTQTN
jgi:predicted  nucleic acid-binding Zn-ribbon protein